MRREIWIGIILGVFCLFPQASWAKSRIMYTIVIKDHRFHPEELVVPTGKKIKLIVDNQDPTPEEFESYDLNREKIVGGNKKITVYIGPLKEGIYKYFGEFHEATAQGVIKAVNDLPSEDQKEERR